MKIKLVMFDSQQQKKELPFQSVNQLPDVVNAKNWKWALFKQNHQLNYRPQTYGNTFPKEKKTKLFSKTVATKKNNAHYNIFLMEQRTKYNGEQKKTTIT